jgi:mRNA interferase RelE/StbE
MAYQIIIKRPAEKELDALSTSVRERIVEHMLALEDNPRPAGIKKLQGEDGFRLRVGDYRVLYMIDDRMKQVTIFAVGHRREVYR